MSQGSFQTECCNESLTAPHVRIRSGNAAAPMGPGQAGLTVQMKLLKQMESYPYHNYRDGSEIAHTGKKEIVVAREIEYSTCAVCIQGISPLEATEYTIFHLETLI